MGIVARDAILARVVLGKNNLRKILRTGNAASMALEAPIIGSKLERRGNRRILHVGFGRSMAGFTTLVGVLGTV